MRDRKNRDDPSLEAEAAYEGHQMMAFVHLCFVFNIKMYFSILNMTFVFQLIIFKKYHSLKHMDVIYLNVV